MDRVPMMAAKALAWPEVAPRYGGDAGQGKGGTQRFQTVYATARNGLYPTVINTGIYQLPPELV